MAYFGFTNKLLKGATIEIFNYGNCQRDFTSIDDIVYGVIRVMQGAPEKETGEDGLPIQPYAVYNIGNQNPENLLDFVDILQQELIAAGVLPAAPPCGKDCGASPDGIGNSAISSKPVCCATQNGFFYDAGIP